MMTMKYELKQSYLDIMKFKCFNNACTTLKLIIEDN